MKPLCLVVLVLALLLFGYFVWPTPYEYGRGISGPGHIGVPYRTNRITGKTEWWHRWASEWTDK